MSVIDIKKSYRHISPQELLDEEISQMWESLDYEGLNVEATKEWFAQSDIFMQILEKLKEENE